MFIIPKGVLNRINTICRNFLWDGGVEGHRVPPIAWTTICKPKRLGGLGLKDSNLWNAAAVGKLVWWIVSKADRLWVLWVNHIYMKGADFINYHAPSDTSWYWRKICSVKEILVTGYFGELGVVENINYSIKKCYQWLAGRENQEGSIKTMLHFFGLE